MAASVACEQGMLGTGQWNIRRGTLWIAAGNRAPSSVVRRENHIGLVRYSQSIQLVQESANADVQLFKHSGPSL